MRANDQKILPKWESLASYSIIHIKGLVITGQWTATIELGQKGFLALWPYNALENAQFCVSGHLPVSHKSVFEPRSDIRNYFFDAEKVEKLFQLATCGSCANLIRFISAQKHRHCRITVSFVLKIIEILNMSDLFIKHVLIDLRK